MSGALSDIVSERRAACEALGVEVEKVREAIADPLGIKKRVRAHPLLIPGATAAGAFALTQLLSGSRNGHERSAGAAVGQFGLAALAAWALRAGLSSVVGAWLERRSTEKDAQGTERTSPRFRDDPLRGHRRDGTGWR